ncbi:VOC family protein [Propionibacteriaceae bacterium Y1685]
MISHDVHGKTQRDVDLARRISELAAERGMVAEPSAVSRVEVGLDTWDAEEIQPFWRAVLGLEPHPRSAIDLVDPDGNKPTLWFQQCEPHQLPQQRFHLDIRVPPEVAEQRIAAALAAGGELISDERAPRFTVLADPQGNKVCVCTQAGRDD